METKSWKEFLLDEYVSLSIKLLELEKIMKPFEKDEASVYSSERERYRLMKEQMCIMDEYKVTLKDRILLEMGELERKEEKKREN